MVAVVSLSSSATLIGFTHPQPSGGALILAQAEIKFIAIKSVQVGSNFRQPFGPSLSGFKGSQAGFPSSSPALPLITVQTRQCVE